MSSGCRDLRCSSAKVWFPGVPSSADVITHQPYSHTVSLTTTSWCETAFWTPTTGWCCALLPVLPSLCEALHMFFHKLVSQSAN